MLKAKAILSLFSAECKWSGHAALLFVDHINESPLSAVIDVSVCQPFSITLKTTGRAKSNSQLVAAFSFVSCQKSSEANTEQKISPVPAGA